MRRIIRVFPRRTKATPNDESAWIGSPDLFVEADAVEVSVTFTWDKLRAERLAAEWERIAPVTMSGPAIEPPTGDFEPGRFLRHGYTITSRGCPNRCWFCRAWKGGFRELPVRDGWIVQDDNLLACSEPHIRAVFAMLARQPKRVSFAGGLEAARLKDWHVELLAGLKPRPDVFLAYDEPDDWEPLVVAAGKLREAGFTAASHRLRCYVLIGQPGDRLDGATDRLESVVKLGLTPSAMLYRGPNGTRPSIEWRRLQRSWMRPAAIHSMLERI